MRHDKQKAIHLRKLGRSYSSISVKLNIPKATLSDWLRNTEWSKKIKEKLSREANAKQAIKLKELGQIKRDKLKIAYKEAAIEAKKEFQKLKHHPLFISGLSIYWGEGDKSTHHTSRIGNVDPDMIRIFIKFLTKLCGVPKEKIRAYVLLYPDLEEQTCKNFWILRTGLVSTNFTKCIRILGRHKTRRLTYGVCTVGYSSTYFKVKMFEWLKLLSKEFV